MISAFDICSICNWDFRLFSTSHYDSVIYYFYLEVRIIILLSGILNDKIHKYKWW